MVLVAVIKFMPRRKKENDLKKFYPILVLAGILFLLLSLVFVVSRRGKQKEVPITKDQIMVQRGDEVVIINRNGLIEYRSKDHVFYETWDSARVSSFFNSMQSNAKDYLAGNKSCTSNCYTVFLFVDGKLVTIQVSPDDPEVEDIFDPIDEGGGYDDTIISDLFGSTTPTPTTPTSSIFGSTPTPTVPVYIISPTPTPIYQTGNQGDNYPPVDSGCDAWSKDIYNKAIISNTLCTAQPTPTP